MDEVHERRNNALLFTTEATPTDSDHVSYVPDHTPSPELCRAHTPHVL